MNFSKRTAWDLTENDLTAATRARRAAGLDLIDLTVSNPTVCGFHYDEPQILAPLSNPAALHYTADPLGLPSARHSVAAYYSDQGATVPLDRLCLTTSTSEAYSYLFRLLCDPGDEVLVARPSYPLFDYIARLDDVTLREYPLLYDPNADPNADDAHGWSIDLHALESALTPHTRALIVVHPNNPTGNFASAAEQLAIEQLCARQGIALIIDEVFLDYALPSDPDARAPSPAKSFATGDPECLTFVLSGISKVCGLPQMKVSWIAACGPARLVDPALARLEVIADTFLSMNAPAQHALSAWLAGRHTIQSQVHERMVLNLKVLDAHLCGTSAQRLAMQAGWTVVLRVPRTVDGQPFVEAALDRGVLVQPGEFYGLGEGRVVLSLLTPPDIWAQGLALLPLD